MKKNEPWDMMADNKIWDMLMDTTHNINEDYTRLMFIELFRRIKNLEQENSTMKVLLFQSGLIDEKIYYDALEEVKKFYKEWDNNKAQEIDFFANSGISFVDWAVFTQKGKFDKNVNDL